MTLAAASKTGHRSTLSSCYYIARESVIALCGFDIFAPPAGSAYLDGDYNHWAKELFSKKEDVSPSHSGFHVASVSLQGEANRLTSASLQLRLLLPETHEGCSGLLHL